MKKLFFATGNQGKVKELVSLIAPYDVEILTMKDFPAFEAPEETGTTFQENAYIKAKAAVDYSGIPALADDSGITVDALKGAPGVYSARYSGENATSESNNQKLLDAMRDVPVGQRQAQFRASLALVFPDGRKFFSEGVIEGELLFEYRGDGGFGYDPLFYLESYGKTTAELTMEEKNKISHRGRAFKDIVKQMVDVGEL
ncbi:MAG: XTP/dITP diphosphatase [Bacillota bacterium]|nr:XTP/dITP diphosphatase [Bacillota bacterium]